LVNSSSMGRYGNGSWFFQFSTGTLLAYVYNSSNTGINVGSFGTLVAGTTYQIQLSWDGTHWYGFLNGTLKFTYSTALTLQTVGSICLTISDAPSYGITGTIDEVRISSVCRNTTTYTPATLPFSSVANTGCLYHLDA